MASPTKRKTKRAPNMGPEAKRLNRPHRLGRTMSGVVSPSVRKMGFAKADLLTRWSDIIGPDLARVTQPVKLTRAHPGADGSGLGRRKEGGTLILRVVGAMAPEIEARSPQVIDRINQFYGFKAVAHIQLLQGLAKGAPVPKTFPTSAPLWDESDQQDLDKRLDHISSQDLKDRLEALGKQLILRSRSG